MGRRAQETGGHGRHGATTTAFTYDAGDRPTQITDSVGGTITRTYENGARRFSGGSCSAGT
jgi:YD repeat-containing protein